MPMNNRLMRPRAASGPGANTLLLMHFDNPGDPGGVLKDSSQYNRNIQVLTGTATPSGLVRFGSTATGQFSLNLAFLVTGVPLGAGRNVFPDLSQTDHTIECWVYYPMAGASSVGTTIAHLPVLEDLTSTTGQHLYISGDHVFFNDGAVGAAATENYPEPAPMPLDQWFHLAAVQKGNCKRIFINGQVKAIATQNAPAGACSLSVGGYVFNDGTDITYNNVSEYQILIDELRISSRALYTSNFTPPNAPFSSDSPAAAATACCLPAGFDTSGIYCAGTDLVADFADGLCGSVTTVVVQNGCP